MSTIEDLTVPEFGEDEEAIMNLAPKFRCGGGSCGSVAIEEAPLIKWNSKPPTKDMVNHPPHYTNHPSGIECIQITRHMNFLLGNAMKYIWRVDDKGDPIENLEKSIWYLQQEIERRKENG